MQESRIQVIDSSLFEQLVQRARESPRLRTNYNFHQTMEENPHRFLNVMLKETYIAPHRHRDPPKAESFLVLAGEVAFFTFNEKGQVVSLTVLGQDPMGVDVQPGVWHTMAVLTEPAVCFEVKPGPYSAANDKDFASWAPREGDAAAPEYLAGLISRVPAPL